MLDMQRQSVCRQICSRIKGKWAMSNLPLQTEVHHHHLFPFFPRASMSSSLAGSDSLSPAPHQVTPTKSVRLNRQVPHPTAALRNLPKPFAANLQFPVVLPGASADDAFPIRLLQRVCAIRPPEPNLRPAIPRPLSSRGERGWKSACCRR